MLNDALDKITRCMASSGEMYTIQQVQTAHRIKLAEFWGIRPGMKVLEIGCGQGDTTAVLAYFVGESGFVHGVDIASGSYGGPITLGESATFLQQSELGKGIQIEFEIDVLSESVDYPEQSYDAIVLSHCSWYLKSADELLQILSKARRWGKLLWFAEWDPRITGPGQYAHFLAALIQAQYESFKPGSEANVRTLLTPLDIRGVAEAAGWSISREETIDSGDMQDGQWEVEFTLRQYEAEIEQIDSVPEKFRALIRSEAALLKESAKASGIKSLSTYAMVGD